MRPIEFERRVCCELQRWAKLRAGDAVVLAVSGGPDSMALLAAVDERNRRERLGWRLHVAHVNHARRGLASDEDARFVEAGARQRGLPCSIDTLDTSHLPRADGPREATLRRLRYESLERIARSVGATVVATAHHADDQAETILHRIARGSGLRGLAGMRAIRSLRRGSPIRLARPMLDLTRDEVDAYLRARAIEFRRDGSNRELSATRNRIRHVVLPTIEEHLNPRVRRALRRLATAARWSNEFVEATARRSADAIVRLQRPNGCVLDAAGLAAEARIVQLVVLRKALVRSGAREGRLRFEHLCRLADLAASGRTGQRVEIPGFVVWRTRAGLSIERRGGPSRGQPARQPAAAAGSVPC